MNDSSPLVSIVILNYNGLSCLYDCLRSVLNTEYGNFEVILVDNASTDNSLTIATKHFASDPRLKILANPTNVGFSGGNNIGYEHAKGEYIVFLNNDTIVDAEWINPLVNAMQNDSTIGLAQSLILNIDGQTIQRSGWLFSDYLIQKIQLSADQPYDLKLQPTFEVSFVCGASMMIRREIVEEMGLFDPEIPFFYDDTLLSLKTWLAQKRVVTIPASKIRHISGGTNAWKIRFTTYHLLKSRLCLQFDVYPELPQLSSALLIQALYLSFNSIFLLKKRNAAALVGNIQALTWGLTNLRFLWRNRINHWSKTKISPAVLREKFVRIRIPLPLYFLPSKLSSNYLAAEAARHEKAITQAS